MPQILRFNYPNKIEPRPVIGPTPPLYVPAGYTIPLPIEVEVLMRRSMFFFLKLHIF